MDCNCVTGKSINLAALPEGDRYDAPAPLTHRNMLVPVHNPYNSKSPSPLEATHSCTTSIGFLHMLTVHATVSIWRADVGIAVAFSEWLDTLMSHPAHVYFTRF